MSKHENINREIWEQYQDSSNTEKICRNCKFWGDEYEGVCSKVRYHTNLATQFEIEAWADDDQGLETRLLTGPDFGCIHFLSKYHKMSEE